MDNFLIQIVLIILTAIAGVLFGAYFQSRFQHQKDLKKDIHELKRRRYGAIIVYMHTLLTPGESLAKVNEIRPNLSNEEDIHAELHIETINSILFARDEVIKALAEFYKEPNLKTCINTAAEMRRDLWNAKTKIDEKTLEVLANKPCSV